VITYRKMRWAGHVALMGEGRDVYRVFFWGDLRERDRWGDTGVNGRMIFRWISGSGVWGYGLD
jgi:hypothetical protein